MKGRDALDETVDWVDNQSRTLHTGALVGAGGLVVAIGLGVAANVRGSGLAVAPALASEPLILRSLIVLLYGCVALLTSSLWSRMGRAALSHMQPRVDQLIALCAGGPLLVLAANYSIATGITPDHVALLPAAVGVSTAILYAVIVHRLSGITGAGLGARLVLRSSYVWLLITAGLHFFWVTARVFIDRPDALWFVERPTVEVGLIGFGVTGALGVLLSGLNAVYHSRNMTQSLMRLYQPLNGLILLWGLSLMWSLRFPGSHQGLVSAVLAIALLLILGIIIRNSGLLARENIPFLGDNVPSDGVWAGGLASMVALLVIVAGVLVAVTGVVLAALGEQPPEQIVGGQLLAVGMGVVPLAVLASVAAIRKELDTLPATGAALIIAGSVTGLVLWSVQWLVERPIAGLPHTSEMMVGLGIVLVALAVQQVDMPR